jgi:hypothetical protein
MNPVTRGAAETKTFSEPMNGGIEKDAEGGAAAPMQNAEQALHLVWGD